MQFSVCIKCDYDNCLSFSYSRFMSTILSSCLDNFNLQFLNVNFKFFLPTSCVCVYITICMQCAWKEWKQIASDHTRFKELFLSIVCWWWLLFMPWEALKEFVWDFCRDFTIITVWIFYFYLHNNNHPYYVLNWWMDYNNMTDFFVCYLLSEVM